MAMRIAPDMQAGERQVGAGFGAAQASLQGSVDAARDGANVLRPLLAQTGTATVAANKSADNIHAVGNAVAAAADGLDPMIRNAQGDAQALRDGAQGAFDRAQPWLDSGENLLLGNRGGSGMSGEFWSLYDRLDPTLQTAIAANDARSEVQAQMATATRALTRAGVAPTAAAVASLQARLSNYASALVSTTKTAAQQAGIQLQMGALEQGMKMAIDASGMGEQLLRDSIGARTAAAEAEGAAGNMQAQKGGLLADQGRLEVAGAELRLDAAKTGTEAAGAYQRAQQGLSQSLQYATEWETAQAASILDLIQSGAPSDSIARLTGGGMRAIV